MKTSLYIASDHAGFAFKTQLKKQFPEIDWQDLGPQSEDRVDYPDFADQVVRKVTADIEKGLPARGVLICGSGQGMAIRANRHPQIRAALCWSAEVSRLSREHNDANVLCLSGRLIEAETNFEIFRAFLETQFEGGRHTGRVEKLGLPC